MIKLKTTKRHILSHSMKVYAVGYCELQYLLKYCNAFAYSAGVYGWSCDYYDIDGYIISTGYSPAGERVDYDLTRKYEKKAKQIANNYDLKPEQRQKRINKLLNQFIKELKK